MSQLARERQLAVTSWNEKGQPMRLWIKLMIVAAVGVMLAAGAQAWQRQAVQASVARVDAERVALFMRLRDDDLSAPQRAQLLERMVELCEEEARLNGSQCSMPHPLAVPS